MNGLDDGDTSARLSSLFDDEPPMASTAVDDLARGRRLQRRRRGVSVVAAATALPVLIGGWALGGVALGGLSGSASDVTAAAGSESADQGDGETCWVIRDSFITRPDDAAFPRTDESEVVDCDTLPLPTDPCTSRLQNHRPDPFGWSDGSVVSDGSFVTKFGWICDDLAGVLARNAALAPNDATARPLYTALTTQDGLASESASIVWTDGPVSIPKAGDRNGQTSLSLDRSPDGPAATGCLDPNLASGPDVTCEARTLDDGTVVRIGYGSQDGAERIAVRYDRPDGSVVWATADEATFAWWSGDALPGHDPLTSSPMTVDALIAMALDERIN
jgi:hypothetical protein